jgi:hypothetical protein
MALSTASAWAVSHKNRFQYLVHEALGIWKVQRPGQRGEREIKGLLDGLAAALVDGESQVGRAVRRRVQAQAALSADDGELLGGLGLPPESADIMGG